MTKINWHQVNKIVKLLKVQTSLFNRSNGKSNKKTIISVNFPESLLFFRDKNYIYDFQQIYYKRSIEVVPIIKNWHDTVTKYLLDIVIDPEKNIN